MWRQTYNGKGMQIGVVTSSDAVHLGLLALRRQLVKKSFVGRIGRQIEASRGRNEADPTLQLVTIFSRRYL